MNIWFNVFLTWVSNFYLINILYSWSPFNNVCNEEPFCVTVMFPFWQMFFLCDLFFFGNFNSTCVQLYMFGLYLVWFHTLLHTHTCIYLLWLNSTMHIFSCTYLVWLHTILNTYHRIKLIWLHTIFLVTDLFFLLEVFTLSIIV